MCRAIVAIASAITIATLSVAYAEDQAIEADNGGAYRITQITHTKAGGATASITPPTGPSRNMQFDCHGHMMTYSQDAQAFGPSRYVPPRGVFGKIEQVVCEHGRVDQ